jgi:hypothetical protein
MNPLVLNFFQKHKHNNFVWPLLAKKDIDSQFNFIVNSKLPWLEILGIDAPYAKMLQEAQSLNHRFVRHRESQQHQGWQSVCIHGMSAEHTTYPEAYGLDSKTVKYDWTDIQDQCPVTVEFFKNVFPYESYQRLRYMLLEPGGYILPHHDFATNHVLNAINISLNNPDDCCLVSEFGTVPFKNSGSIFAFNNHYQHAAFNNSTTARYHIIVHGIPATKFKIYVINSYQKFIKSIALP